jgi:hypothetical protein
MIMLGVAWRERPSSVAHLNNGLGKGEGHLNDDVSKARRRGLDVLAVGDGGGGRGYATAVN